MRAQPVPWFNLKLTYTLMEYDAAPQQVLQDPSLQPTTDTRDLAENTQNFVSLLHESPLPEFRFAMRLPSVSNELIHVRFFSWLPGHRSFALLVF